MRLMELDPALAKMESETVQKAMGLMASGRPRGRPRKEPVYCIPVEAFKGPAMA